MLIAPPLPTLSHYIVHVYTLARLRSYMIDMTTGDKLRLRSMYAEQEDDVLLFQLIDDGEGLKLLETDLCSRIDPGVFAYLTACGSVPAFLSNLTTNLFEKQTFLGGQ